MELSVEGSDFNTLRALRLTDRDGMKRADLCLPTPEEYFSICKKYEKKAIFELKNRFEKEHIAEIIAQIREMGYLENTIFISFFYSNMKDLRSLLPTQPAQYLYYGEINEELIAKLKDQDLDLDVRHDRLNEETVALLQKNNIAINCWTVDDPARAKELIEFGVDYITGNILE